MQRLIFQIKYFKSILRITLFFFSSTMLRFLLFLIILFFSQKNIFDREIRRPFECGFSTTDESRSPFSLRFFLVAIIFLVFDVEVLLLFPVLSGVSFNNSITITFVFFSFLLVLSIGLFFE